MYTYSGSVYVHGKYVLCYVFWKPWGILRFGLYWGKLLQPQDPFPFLRVTLTEKKIPRLKDFSRYIGIFSNIRTRKVLEILGKWTHILEYILDNGTHV